MIRRQVGSMVLAVAGAMVMVCGTAAAVTLPSADPFYAVPTGISGMANGTILASRSVSVSFESIPMTARAWQVKYKSLDNAGRPTADVTTIMIPDSPWLGNGPRPLVSYQTAEDGISTSCSPSYALREGISDSENNSEAETGLIELALLRGWAVAAPDYEGPDSLFLAPAQEAHGVLDGIRAALHFKPDGLGTKTPLGLWGYSGGSVASDEAAQFQPAYAPELHLRGVALGGLVGSLKETLNDFSGGPVGGAIVMGFAAANRDYPSVDLLQYLNAAGRKAVAASENDCLAEASSQFPFASVAEYEAVPNVESVPAIANLLDEMSPLDVPGVPAAPIFDYHSSYDELAPIGPDRQQMRRFCAEGVKVDHLETVDGEHIVTTVTDAPLAIAWLSDRFAGKPAPDNCSTIP